MEFETRYNFRRRRRRPRRYIAVGIFFLCVAFVGTFVFAKRASTPPEAFPVGIDIVIEEGLNQGEIIDHLRQQNVIRSPLLLHMMLIRSFEDEFIHAGIYRFPAPLTLREVAEALTQGLYKSPALTLMLPEGFSVKDLYRLLPEGYAHDGEIRDLTEYEGRLFPDTYFIEKSMTVDEIVTLLLETMEERLQPYESIIAESDFTKEEVLILASILEREANDVESMRRVSGILQNRLEIGMALQVDATLNYVLGKTSAELTVEDLEMDSPFNTYTNAGLPPHPIANPGITAIEAVLYPIASEDLYYLTGDDGVFYYAETFEAHKRNKELYLR